MSCHAKQGKARKILAAKRVSDIGSSMYSGIANRLTAIETRVARIKARVAELTGNMEGTTAPTANKGQ